MKSQRGGPSGAGVGSSAARDDSAGAAGVAVTGDGQAGGRQRVGRGNRRQQFEREAQIVRGVESILAPLLEAATDDPFERRRCVRRELGRIVFEDSGQRLRTRLTLKCPPARQHLVDDHTQREDVRAMVDRLPTHLLGRHIAHGAHHNAKVGMRASD